MGLSHRIGLLVALIGCNPPDPYDNNASNPAPSPSLTYLWQSETSVVGFHKVTSTAREDRVLVGYNDLSGFDADNSGIPVVKTSPSFAGLSLSRDAGRTWSRRTFPAFATPDACGTPPCATALLGDPWLATNGSRILYTNIASTRAPTITNGQTDFSDDSIAVFWSDDGGDTWSPPQIAFTAAFAEKPDKESVSMLGATAVIVHRGGGNLQISTSDDEGASWSPEIFVPVLIPGLAIHDPVVVLTDGVSLKGQFTATEGYVAYLGTPVVLSGGNQIYAARITRITRAVNDTNWSSEFTDAFGRDTLSVNYAPPGGLGRSWYDGIPMRFVVGGTSGHHLYIAYRERDANSGLDAVLVADCEDVPTGTCHFDSTAVNNVGWRFTSFATPVVRGQTFVPGGAEFQPDVAVRGNTVAVTYYQRFATSGASTAFTGWYSTDGGGTYHPGSVPVGGYDLRPNGGAAVPCPGAPDKNRGGAGYYGDYHGSTILPLTFPLEGGGSTPRIVTAFADSAGGCAFEPGSTSFFQDQHVRAVAW